MKLFVAVAFLVLVSVPPFEARGEGRTPAADSQKLAQWRKAIDLLDNHPTPEAIGQALAIVQPLAEGGLPEAENTLGWMYDLGKGVPRDPQRAFDLYKKAAFSGEPSAASNLGDIYYDGRLGQAVDKVLSRKWYEEGANRGNQHAGFCLAWACMHGDGGPIDRPKALRVIYTVADVSQSKEAQAYLARLYALDGEGVPKNLTLALMWSLLAGNELKGMASFKTELTPKLSPSEIDRAVAAAESCRETLKAGGYVIPSEHLPDWKIDYAPVSEWKTVVLQHGRHILIPLMIGGQGPFDFILDTGCSCSLIDGDLAVKLGLKEGGVTGLQGAGVQPVFLADGELFGHRLTQTAFIGQSMESINRLSPRKISGFIGYDLISRFVVEIDYGNSKVRFSDPGRYTYTRTGKAVPLQFAAGTPYLTGTVRPVAADPIQGPVLLDTGSQGEIDCYGRFDRVHDFSKLVPKTIRGLAARMSNGDFDGVLGRFQSFSCGDFVVPSPAASCLPGQMDAGGTSGVALGGGFLNRFNLVLDYPHRRLILESTERLTKVDPLYYTGAGFEFVVSGELRVFHLDAGSPADVAGLKVGDDMIECSGFKGDGLWEGSWSVLRSKKENSVTVKRDGKEMILTVVGEEY